MDSVILDCMNGDNIVHAEYCNISEHDLLKVPL